MSDEAITAVVVARLDDLRTDFAAMRAEVRESAQQSVSRGEWGQRNAHVDTRLDAVGREVGDLRADLASRRAPWWSTWAIALAAAGFAWSILEPVVRGGT